MLTIKDFKTAFNSLLKAKGYAITIVLTLGITLGVLVAMFNLNYQVLVAPLPYPDQDQLYLVKSHVYKNAQLAFGDADIASYASLVEAYKQIDDAFLQKALIYSEQGVIRNLLDTPQVNTSFITPEYLQLLQTPMAMGRSFNANEGLDSHIPVAVISYNLWRQELAQTPDVLNKTLRLGEVDFKIIGVTAANFVEPEFESVGRVTEVWLPWDYSTSDEETRRSWTRIKSGYHLVAKLKQGVQPTIVEQSLTKTLNTRFEAERAGNSFFQELTIGVNLLDYKQAILGDSKTRMLLLFFGALMLLLLAAVNIMNLILARVSNQQRSMAIQAALGAQKYHLFNRLFAEIILLLVFAAGLACVVSWFCIVELKSFAHSQLPRVMELHLSVPSLLFTLCSGLVLAFSIAFLVSQHINYRALNALLQSSGKGAGIQISAKVRSLLVLSQAMFTALLLVASLHVLQQSWQHIHQPLGFATEDIYRISLNAGLQADKPYAERKSDFLAIRQELLSQPNVAAVSVASDDPINSDGLVDYISQTPDYAIREQVLLSYTDQFYFNLLGVKWLAGRNFTANEFSTNEPVAIINETLARKLQADGQVLNRYFYWQGNGKANERYEIIAILRDLSLPGVKEAPRLFVPQVSDKNIQLFLQLNPQQSITKQALNESLAQVNNQYRVAEMASLTASHQLLIAQDTLSAWLTAALSFIALSLAAIGIYGVLSYSVQLRQFELGIRMALGARPNTIFLQILKDNLTPVLLGLGIAMLAMLSLWLWLRHISYNLQTSALGWLLPMLLILALTAATSLLSVWHIIRKPASVALRGN